MSIKSAQQFSQLFWQFINSPIGPKTTHFWGPFLSWGLVVQGILDWNRAPDRISRNMELALCCYSMIFMRFAHQVKPRNWLLFSMHFSNFFVQGRLLAIRIRYEINQNKN